MPGTVIRERTNRLARSLPTDTGVYFLAGLAQKGPNGIPIAIMSVTEFERFFGTRQTFSSAWDMVDAFFKEGGTKLFFSRVFGPNPTTATVTLNDSGAVSSLIVTAASPGDWGSFLNVAVEAGDAAGEFKLRVTHDTDTTINELSPSLVDQAAAVLYASNSDYIRVTAGASVNDPAVVAAQSLVGGTDDRANATDATWLTALNAFTKDLGPGQVGYANRTSTVAHGQLADHANLNNRKGLVDPPSTSLSKAALVTFGSTVRALSNARHVAGFAPWVRIGSLLAGGTLREVPPSCVVAGRIAAFQAGGGTPNQPAAGDRGILNSVVQLATTFNDVDANDLNEAHVNIIKVAQGDFKIFGWRSGATKLTNPIHWQFGNQRLYMAISAEADEIMQGYILREIDGKGNVFSELQGELIGMLDAYFKAGSLYGATASEAFFVDVGAQINTPQTIANGEIRAAIELTMSPMGETVILDIVRRQIA